ncbi:MAG: polysaccharide pyruvyl transferase family protein [Candidatus Aminicenantes bacterium]|nr:polysaccharide pyruvyl transferase family protein [Candidatus Aminicenantes bacterium]
MRARSSPRPPVVAVMGTFGEGNTGDDVMLLATVAGVRARRTDARFVIFTCDRDYTERLLEREGVPLGLCECVYTGRYGMREPGRRFPRSLAWTVENLRAIARADILLIGPGTQLQDVTRRFRVLFFLARGVLAWLLGTPYAFFGIGYWKVSGRLSSWVLRWTGRRAAFISTRDRASARALEAHGIPPAKIISLADVSFICVRSAEEAS